MGLLRRLLRRSSVKREWNWDLIAAPPRVQHELTGPETVEETRGVPLPQTKVMLGFSEGDEVHLTDDDARSLEMRRLADEIWLERKVGSRAT